MNEQPVRILMVDDDRHNFLLTRSQLEEIEGRTFTLDWVNSYDEARDAIHRGEHDVYLIDYRLGVGDGLALMREAMERGCRAPMIMMTNQANHEIDMQAMKAGAADYLVKSQCDASRLERCIRYALERRRLLDELERERALLHALLDHLPDSIYFKDRDSRFLRASRALADHFGVADPDELAGKCDFDFFTDEHAQQALDDEKELMLGNRAMVQKEEKETWPDGRTTWVASTKLPLRGRDGRIVGTFGISRDVTVERLAEEALRESERRMRLIIDTAYDAFVAMDAEGRIVDWNPQAEVAFGWSRDEALGRTLADTIIPHRYRAAHNEGLRHFLATGHGPVLNRRIEITALHRNGREFPVELTISPIRLGDTYLFSAFVHDITNRKQVELALREAKEAAESASRAKSDFLANMSHEIRTPMNAIIGMSELLLDTSLSSEQQEYMRMVHQSAESLLAVIDDILDFSKIEAGRLDLDREVFELRESLGDTMKTLAVRAHNKHLELACHVALDVPERLEGDIGRLRQIVVNLVGNAIKFTDQGEVVLDVSMARDGDTSSAPNQPSAPNQSAEDGALGEVDRSAADGASAASGDASGSPASAAPSTAGGDEKGQSVLLHFSVRDTGIGIAPEKLAMIFDAFSQADTSTTRRFGGTGLGLAISSRLVELMGGRIWVESAAGQGSNFHFTAELAVAPDGAAAHAIIEPQAVRDTRVLVVDDSATNARILEEMLRNWGMRPVAVLSARDALTSLRREAAADEPYHLVLSDVNMPEMDGFSLAEAIKTDRNLDSTVIMMLTSGTRPGDFDRCKELGVAAHLIKPIKQSELFDAIIAALGADQAIVESDADDAPTIRYTPRHILLAEDSVVNQKLAVGLLARHKHDVTVVNNGREAIDALGRQSFDLVLMDVQMPELDGLEATSLIRQEEKQTGGRIPIIAMTAHAMAGDRERCLEAGMDDYIAKPVRAADLFAKIAAWSGGNARTGTGDDETADDAGSDPAQLVHWDEALAAVAGDRTLLREVVGAFLSETGAMIESIEKAIDTGDAPVVRRSAHTIKGTLRLLGARAALAKAEQLEFMGRDRRLADAPAVFSLLSRELQKLRPVLVAFTDEDDMLGNE